LKSNETCVKIIMVMYMYGQQHDNITAVTAGNRKDIRQ